MTSERPPTNEDLMKTGERYIVFTNSYGKDNFADMFRRDKTPREYLSERFARGDAVVGKGRVVPAVLNPLASFYRRLPLLSPLYKYSIVELPTKSSILSSETHLATLDFLANLKPQLLAALNRDYQRNMSTTNAVWCVYVCRCNYETVKDFLTGDYVFGYTEFGAYDFVSRMDARLKSWKGTLNHLDRLEEALVLSHALFLKTLDEYFEENVIDPPAIGSMGGQGDCNELSRAGFLQHICVELQSELHVIGHGDLYSRYIAKVVASKKLFPVDKL